MKDLLDSVDKNYVRILVLKVHSSDRWEQVVYTRSYYSLDVCQLE